MKIRKIKIENNLILWDNFELDFTKDWKTLDTIILVWENGSWKSTILNIIYEFSEIKIINDLYDNEKRIFEIEFCNEEIKIINQFYWEVSNKIFTIEFNLSSSKWGWEQIKIFNKGNEKEINKNIFIHKSEIKALFKSIFSDVSINFSPKEIKNSTWIDIDSDVKISKKSNENISTDIKQMLVDIRINDNEDDRKYFKENWKYKDEKLTQLRTKRFKNAFKLIFKDRNLEYYWVDLLTPIFKKDWHEINIDKLSSWEKQIVFRWSYLLKDKESIKWAIGLIDEPEISLHPLWQQKILDFYTNLFKDWNGNQTSQLFISTHSPYVLQWYDLNYWGLFIFPSWKRIDNLRSYIWEKPSLWVVNYEAYNLATVEFHDELYWYIYDKIKSKNMIEIDIYLWEHWFQQNINRIQLNWKNYPVTLGTFIRNKLHHPENTNMQSEYFSNEKLRESIDKMIDIINNNGL